MLDELRVILAAEGAARQQFDAAREESTRLVQQAEVEARDRVRAAREEREAVAHAVEERIVADAQQEASRILDESTAAAAAMRAAAQPRLAEAVEAVIRSVLGPEGEGGHGG
ncbi:MAG TPA: V-type ATPase subunit subunit G family protein [Candidatus Dormibacteraeota bacterium]|nr:V-type ATPase subunit subunit G family protein [Candidatus Dormibacteraeota bacterium]